MSKTTTKEPELFEAEKLAAPAKKTKARREILPAAPAQAQMPAVQPSRGARPPAIAEEPRTLYSAIIQAARDPKVDAEKMKTLVELQIQVEQWEAQKAFTRAFNALQAELPTIDKDGKIDHGEGRTARGNEKLKTKYSTYPNLMGVCRPLLKKHGFTFNNIIEPTPDGARIVVVGYLTHIDGHSMASRFPLGADAGPGRSNAQAWGSATSYGKRYNLILTLDIVSEAPQDVDNDGYLQRHEQQDEPISDEQADRLRKAIDDSGVGADKFCKKFNIGSVPELPARFFNDAVKACENYAQELKNRSASAKTRSQRDDTFPPDR